MDQRLFVLYLSSSQYSGSTLFSFLLNTHPKIATIGHTTGWNFGKKEDFRCSCGEPLTTCPFYSAIADAYKTAGLPFDIRNFGTAYRLVGNERINRYLTAGLPFFRSTALEKLRDSIVQLTSGLSGTLHRIDHSNDVFMRTALAYYGAKVFLDNSHDPYRLRQLARNKSLRIANLHLVRDPRGVVLSIMRHAGWQPVVAARVWLRRQLDIIRINREIPDSMTVYYEDLCTRVDETLAQIHRFSNIEPQAFQGDFKTGEHHILGNVMRLADGKIRLDEKWRTGLTGDKRSAVEDFLREAAERERNPGLDTLLRHYLGDN